MATLTELSTMQGDNRWNGLSDKVKAAAVKKAVAVIDDAVAPAERLSWADSVLNNPNGAAQSVIWYVIGKNAGATIDQIFSATDADIEANINSAVDAIYK